MHSGEGQAWWTLAQDSGWRPCPVADMLCDLEQTFPLSGPELPELKCEKVRPVVSNSGRSLTGGGAFDSSF